MRVIAGKYKSRVLKSLRGAALRPTSDRLRETLFNILGATVEGCVFVDVYAGTGAVGIEALSRGAQQVIFIEKHAAAAALIRANLQSLGAAESLKTLPYKSRRARPAGGLTWRNPSAPEVLATDALRGLGILAARHLRADYIFLDPPYADHAAYQLALDALDASPMLLPSGRIIVEHQRRFALPDWLHRLERTRVVEQGDAALSFYRLALAA